jgi:hypothetical protein
MFSLIHNLQLETLDSLRKTIHIKDNNVFMAKHYFILVRYVKWCFANYENSIQLSKMVSVANLVLADHVFIAWKKQEPFICSGGKQEPVKKYILREINANKNTRPE